MAKLKDRVALITGAASGIGRATALAVAREGSRVVVSDVQEPQGREVAEEIAKHGGEAIFVAADVSQAGDVENLVSSAIDRFGRLDYACNNAGIEGKSAPVDQVQESDWDKTIGINLTGVWLCMKYELKHMLEAGGGSIVNMASVAGVVGFQGGGAYTASKHGVVGLTRAAALDYAQNGIRINAICPGVVRTAMIQRYTQGNPEAEAALVSMEPMGRMGKPEEIADSVIWLFSDESSFVTGQAIPIDGGLTSR
jgi:NAD(P)-dependent dehydrogenase (short-subunit alcohol dehydrogenase family)